MKNSVALKTKKDLERLVGPEACDLMSQTDVYEQLGKKVIIL